MHDQASQNIRQMSTSSEHDGLIDEDLELFAEENGLVDELPILRRAAAESNVTDHDTHEQDQPFRSPHRQRSKWSQPRAMYLTILATGLGAMHHCWSQTAINGANLYFPSEFNISPFLTGLINCAMFLSNGLIGCWLVAPLNARLGRRGAVFVGTSLALSANTATAVLAGSWQTMLCWRLVLGIGLGIVMPSLNVFAAECAPPAIRGGLAVVWQLMCAFAIFCAFLTNMLIDQTDLSSLSASTSLGGVSSTGAPLSKWRLMLLAAVTPAIPLMCVIYACPESPAWLVKAPRRRYDLAFESLCRIRSTKLEAAEHLLGLRGQERRTAKAGNQDPSFRRQFCDLFTVPRIRRATLAAYMSNLDQQLSGINIVAFYSSTIFVQADFSPYAAELASVIFGLVNFLGGFPAIWSMDTLGRRSLLLWTLPPMSLTMLLAGWSFSSSFEDLVPSPNVRITFGAGMIYLFCLLYSPGMGPVPPAYSAEVYPLSHRELGTSSAIAVSSIFAAVLSVTFPSLLRWLGTPGAFALYSSLNIVAWTLAFLFMPETKRRSLEELDDVFSIPTRSFIRFQVREYAPWWMRRHVLRRGRVDDDEPRLEYSALNESRRGQYGIVQTEPDIDDP